jgi:outer membrane protein TolC
MRLCAAVRVLLVFSLLMPAPGLVPHAAAQETAAPPPAAPGGAEIDTVPADAIVLSLRECIQQALANNLQIAVSHYDPEVAESFVGIEQSLFDPTLSGSVYHQDQTQISRNDFIGTISSGESTYKDVRASWTDPLTIGGSYRIDLEAIGNDGEYDPSIEDPIAGELYKNYTTRWQFTYRQSLLRNLGRNANIFRIVVAKNSQDISQSQFHQTVLDTVAGAINAYADLNFAILQLRTARFSLKLAQDFLEQNRIKVRVGTLAPIEITQAEAQVADRDEFVIVSEAALRAAEDQIRQAIGMRKDSADWQRPVRPSDPLTLEEFQPNEEDALLAALSNRPDLKQAHLDLQSRETELRARESLRRWGLDFEGTYGNRGFSAHTYDIDQIVDYGSYSDAYDDLRDRNQTTWTAGLFLTVPIHNRLALSNFNAAESTRSQSQVRLAQVEQLARLQVRSGVRDVETTLKRVKASQVNVKLQREKLEAEQKKFENGMSTSFQVLQFQDDLSNAETRENLAKVDYNKSLIELERVKGTLLTRFGVTVEGEGGDSGGESRSAAVRPLWRGRGDASLEPGLRLAESVEAVRLPADFAFAGGRASMAEPSR